MEDISNTSSMSAYPGGYDGRRIAPNGGYTNAGESSAVMSGMTMMQQGSYPLPDPPPGSAADTGNTSSQPFAGQVSFGGAPVAPVGLAAAAALAATDGISTSSLLTTTPRSFSSLSADTSNNGNSTRKRKCSGDGVETCGSCGHRLLEQRMSSGLGPEIEGYCTNCVCRCALCGQAVLRTGTVSTILDEPLLMTARQIGIPIEDSYQMGQDIGLMALVCEDSCMKKLSRMRRMAIRKSPNAANTSNSTESDHRTATTTGGVDDMDLG